MHDESFEGMARLNYLSGNRKRLDNKHLDKIAFRMRISAAHALSIKDLS